MNSIAMLRKAIKDHCTVNITYKKKVSKKNITSQTKDYRGVEPYEIKNGRLYIFDPAAGHIKNFLLREDNPNEGVVFCTVNEGQTFKPRYEIKDAEEKKTPPTPQV